jgi:hypothetical protein
MRASRLLPLAAAAALCTVADAQIVPKDARVPVQVIKGSGKFAARLHGALWPAGKGWKAVTDAGKYVQLMVPERWRVDTMPDGDTILKITPPGKADPPEAILTLSLTAPRDTDPLEVDEPFATGYAEALANEPFFARQGFEATDSGLVVMRGMKLALAGLRARDEQKQVFQNEILIYIAEDRIVTLKFVAREKDFSRFEPEVLGMMASYLTLGMRKIEE